MKRGVILGALVVIGMLTAAVGAVQQAAQQPRVVMPEKLKDNLWVMRGGGGNSAVFVGATGVTVVDTKNPGWGQPLLDEIKKVTDKPVTTIINTHTHGDHVSGNVEFAANVEVVTHANTAANMQKMTSPSGFAPATGNIFKEHGGHGLPKRTFTDRLSLGRGNEQIDLYYFGRGHTNGDAWVVFPSLRVMHAGDIFSGKNLPLLDGNNGGSGVEIGNTLAKAASSVQNIETIITGHAGNMTLADLREYAEFNREFLAAVQAGRKAGQTAEQIAQGWTMPPKYQGYAAVQAPRLLSNVQVILSELR